MEEIRTQIEKKAATMGVKIHGLEDVPWIVQGRQLFDFEGVNSAVLRELGQNETDLFEAAGIMNVAVFPDGHVNGLKAVSSQYNLLQHLDAINTALDYVPSQFGLESIDIKTSLDGGRVWVRMESGLSEEIVPGDKIKYQATLQNSADTSKVMRFVAGAMRLVCSNGMVLPDSRFKKIGIKKLHKSSLNFEKDCKGFFENLEGTYEAVGTWKKYAEHKMSTPALEDVFTALKIGPRVKEEVLGLTMRGGDGNSLNSLLNDDNLTAWDAYNAFTQRITDSNSLESVKIDSGAKVAELFDKMVDAA
jgi:hypothetical protein